MNNKLKNRKDEGCNKTWTGRLQPAIWLAVGLVLGTFSADTAHAQVIVTGRNQTIHTQSTAYYPEIHNDSGTITVNGSSNVTSYAAVAGGYGTGTSSQTSQILPLQFSCTSSVSASAAVSSSGFYPSSEADSYGDVWFQVTVPVRFRITGFGNVSVNELSSGGYYSSCGGSLGLQLGDNSDWGKFMDYRLGFAGPGSNSVTANVSGILLPNPNGIYAMRGDIEVSEGDTVGIIGFQSGSANLSYQITFSPCFGQVSDQILQAPTGLSSAPAVYPAPAITGSCTVSNVVFNPAPGTLLSVGNHTATCTVTFNDGSTDQSQFKVTVLPADYNQITGQLLPGGKVRLAYLGLAGTNYVLDRTFNLSPPVNWVPQLTNTADASGVLIFTNTPNPATNNFWRVRSVP